MYSINPNTAVPIGACIPEEAQKAYILSTMKINLREVTCDWEPTLPQIAIFNPVWEKPRLTTSPIFLVGDPTNRRPTEWRIQVSHDFWLNNGQRTIAIYLWRQDNFTWIGKDAPNNGFEDVYIHYVVQIIDRDGQIFFSRENGFRRFGRAEACGFKDYLNYSEKVRSLIATNGNKLHIRVKMQIAEIADPAQLHVNVVTPVLDDGSKIDVLLDGKPFMKASKAVLIGKSAEFQKLIVNDDGNDSKEVGLFGINPVLLNNMLEFMHQGSCPLLQKGAEVFADKVKLYELASDYVVEDLKVACCSSICDTLPVCFFYEVAIFALNSGCNVQKEHVKAYNTLKHFFRENLEEIKADEKFINNYSTECSYFIELLLGPDK